MDHLEEPTPAETLRADDSPDDKPALSLVDLLADNSGKSRDKQNGITNALHETLTAGLPVLKLHIFESTSPSGIAHSSTPSNLTDTREGLKFSKDPSRDGAPGQPVETVWAAGERPVFRVAERGATAVKAKDYSVPAEMKFGAAADAWDRITADQQKELVQKIGDLKRELLDRSASIAKTEKTTHGFIVKRDDEGRIVSLEKPDKGTRFHFKYDGKSNNIIGMVLEDTKTKSAKTFLAVHSSKEEAIGKREWIAVDSKGDREHFAGDITVAKGGGHSIRLESLTKEREKLEKRQKPETPQQQDVSKARDQLERTAEKRFKDPKELAEYKAGLEKFQKEALAKGLSPKEVAEFFKESKRLLEPDTAELGIKERCRVAKEALAQAIDPTGIDQGRYKTCNVTAVEVCMYSKNPSKVMKAITDAALTLKFTTADGDVITLPKSVLDPDTQRRTLASQLFHTLAVNTYWQDQTKGPDGKRHDRGDIMYDHAGAKRAKGDTGQRVTVTNDKGNRVAVGDPSPNLNTDLYPEIYRRIAGERPETLAIRFGTEGEPGVETVDSKEALHKKLTELSKTPGGFPVILKIHTSNKPFWEDSGAGVEPGAGNTIEEAKKTNKKPGGWHVVTIHGFDPKTGEVKVDNQWGRKVDHLNKPTGKGPIKIEDLFYAMTIHEERLKILGYEPKAKQKQ